jgi:hypothetical protein
MFCALQKTALGAKHGTITATGTAARLYVSTQYARTVSVKEPNDNFLRPCHWVLWSPSAELGLIVSPEEANALISVLRRASFEEPVCHLITYSAPITRHMLQFNDLDYYAVPPLPSTFKAPTWLKVELGIFAGRLYFGWDEYAEIMSYLGVQAPTEEEGSEQPACRVSFAEKPVAFLHEWLAVRRKGQDFEHTPMGFITTPPHASLRLRKTMMTSLTMATSTTRSICSSTTRPTMVMRYSTMRKRTLMRVEIRSLMVVRMCTPKTR